jgi:hypothetical protein
VLKGDTLALASVALPVELKNKDDEIHEVFYERMRLLEELETTLEALWSDFLTLRLSEAWPTAIVPMLRRFAREERVDAGAYLSAKRRGLGKKTKKP